MLDGAPHVATYPVAMALDRERDLFEGVKVGRNCSGFFIWQGQDPCLVAPRAMQKRLESAKRQRDSGAWPLHFRMSGGDITPQGPGIINLAIAYRVMRADQLSFDDHYRRLCQPILDNLSDFGIQASLGSVPGSYCDGNYNVVIDDKKFAGTALRVSRAIDDKRVTTVFAHALMTVSTLATLGMDQINDLYTMAGMDHRIDPHAVTDLKSRILDPAQFCIRLESITRMIFESRCILEPDRHSLRRLPERRPM